MQRMRRIFLSALIVGSLLPSSVSLARTDAWEATLDRIVPAVVAIRIRRVRDFDTTSAGYVRATGFVVDADRGLILTNRHVVSPGPVVAEAMFANHEEVEIRAVYRDPVHDFGLFRYDPKDVKFMTPGEIELAPEQARVGIEIRVVGNDAGEKLSILDGIIARLDREAPRYGRTTFNDFNTFYIQAASATSGGSSGSPVIDVRGRAVALNAGSRTGAASAFYLPLDRVLRAVELIRANKPVPRGTLQTVLRYEPYDEVRRLGLSEATERQFRSEFPEGHGMLVVREVVPGGPADGLLEVGDIVIALGKRSIASFIGWEDVLDRRVGRPARVTVERAGARVTVDIPVQDLHTITPSSFLEVGGGIVHTLSYQRARSHIVPVGGVYVAGAGYFLKSGGLSRGAVITSVGGDPTPTLDAFEKKVASLVPGSEVTLRYFNLGEARRERVGVATVDRIWHGMRRCVRDDTTGHWPCTDSPAPGPRQVPEVSSTTFSSPPDPRAKLLAPSLVMVDFQIPYRTDGAHGTSFKGTGLVIDRKRGLVMVDRDTVPVALGDVTLTFAGSVKIPGNVEYLHPVHGVAFVSYDPKLLGKTPVRSIRIDESPLSSGDDVWLVGLTGNHQVVSRASKVARIDWLALGRPSPPRFRETNSVVIRLTDTISTTGGALTDARGRLRALWMSFAVGRSSRMRGLPIRVVADTIRTLRAGKKPQVRGMSVELGLISLADARSRGLPEAIARRLEKHDPKRRKVITVERLTVGTPAAQLLKEGDLVVAANGKPVTTFLALERAEQIDQVKLTIVRDEKAMNLVVPTVALDGLGTSRALIWAGLLLQAPHRELASQRAIERTGVYVAFWWYGSPAHRYGLRATRRIVEVDGRKIAGLDDFIAAVRDKKDREMVRLTTIDLDGKTDVVTLLLDLEYWPTSELHREGEQWIRTALNGG